MTTTETDPITDELRLALARVTHLLADPELTAGPWISLDDGDRLIRDQPGDEDRAPVYVVNEPMTNGANSRWIELTNPAIGPHIADLLRHAIKHRAACADASHTVWPDDPGKRTSWVDEQTSAPVLAIARLINDRP